MVFDPPEKVHLNQGPDFERKLIHQPQKILGVSQDTQCDAANKRFHSTLFTMIAMLTNTEQKTARYCYLLHE